MTEENPLTAEELAEPLPERIEFTDRHDPYINKRFIEMFDHEDNADVVRQASMILALSDPAQPVEEESTLTASKVKGSHDPEDAMLGKDADGDTITMAYNAAKGAICIRTSPRGYFLPIAKVPGLIKWLLSRQAKHRGEADGVSA